MAKDIQQEPKYFFENGHVFNRASGEMIPDDEPIMIFRARDIHALPMLNFYLSLLNDENHKKAVKRRISHFEYFAHNASERMKEPDTQLDLFD